MDRWLHALLDEPGSERPGPFPEADRREDRRMDRLVQALRRAGPAADWVARARFDPAAPYGRRVIFAKDGAEGEVEVMVAGWSRSRPCAPHDHGGGVGAVRVLQGQARHRRFRWTAGSLRAEPDEVLPAGSLVRCPQGVIHQMQDGAGAQPLVTLHLYLGATPPMTVYDLERGCTQWLETSCGAWPRPEDDPGVLAWAPGLVAPAAGLP